MPDMLPNDELIKSIRERDEKLTEFNGGILLADRYVKTISECVGSDLCYRFASKGNVSFSDVMKRASNTLTYNNPEMTVEDIYGQNKYEWRDNDGDLLELPKHTLMVFRHVLTTPRKDRDGDTMRTKGAVPDPRMVMLSNHVHTLPIGKMLTVYEHNEKRLVLVSALVDVNDLAHDSAKMIEAGMGRFSHGFKALEFERNKEGGGFDIKRFEIMEESLVTVPSNVDAEMQEVLLSMTEGGKLTSPMMKAIGASIREKRPVSVPVGTMPGIKVPITLDLTINGHGTPTIEAGKSSGASVKCSGKPECGCGCAAGADGGKSGASEETNVDAGTAEKGSDDKEMMLCPKCSGKMADGKCTKCGYVIGEKDKSADTDGQKGLVQNYVYSGSLEGSYEAIRNALEIQVGKFLETAGVEMQNPNNAGGRYRASAIGTFDDHVIVSISKPGGYVYYKIDWKDGKDGPTLTGEPKEVKIEISTEIVEKYGDATTKEFRGWFENHIGEKSGRTLNSKNAALLQEAHDSIGEVHDKEHLISKGGKSLCKSAMGSIKTVLDSAEREPPTEASAIEISVKDAARIFLADADELQRNIMKNALQAFDEVDEIKSNTKQYRTLISGRNRNN